MPPPRTFHLYPYALHQENLARLRVGNPRLRAGELVPVHGYAAHTAPPRDRVGEDVLDGGELIAGALDAHLRVLGGERLQDDAASS
jgi:hypothetical protein